MTDPTTLDDIFAKSPSTGGRATNVVIEVKNLLQKWLPQVLERANDESDISIPIPRGYYIAGTPVNSEWPNVMIGFSVATSSLAGVGRVDQDHVSVAAYIAYQRLQSEQELLSCLDTCYWMRSIIMAYRGVHFDQNGLPCWKGIESEGIQSGPKRFPDYEGMAYQFRAWQPGDVTAGRSYWKVG